MQDNVSIKLLLTQIAEGNELAFREVFNSHSGKVYYYALKLTHQRSLAEEIVQDVFMKLWVRRETLTSIDNFEGYLYTIARNHTLNLLKKLAQEEKAKSLLAISMSNSKYNETEEGIDYSEAKLLLEGALNCLPPQQRKVFTLCHNGGLKYEEAAQQLQISPLTVKTHMQHALHSIRKHMKTALTSLVFIAPAFFE